MERNASEIEHIFDFACVSDAFISAIEWPRILAYYPKGPKFRSGAMLAHEFANASLARSWYAMQENSNVPLILYGVPETSAVLAMPG